MSQRVVCDITISLDGFVAGTDQRLSHPFGDGENGRLHQWMFEDAEANSAEQAAVLAPSAYIMGRNMFDPGRGEWDPNWKGWWGEEPPYHKPVFVLTHFPREPLVMQGGTTFTFVTEGIHSAFEQARAAADGRSIGIAGGAETARQYLAAGLVDELVLHIAPFVMGAGENLFQGMEHLKLECLAARPSRFATHLRYRVIR